MKKRPMLSVPRIPNGLTAEPQTSSDTATSAGPE
jgi:hypothetical protein